MYDVEQFLKDAGAQKINEKAIICLENELQDTVNSLVREAYVYANYAGRKRKINASDIELAKGTKTARHYVRRSSRRQRMAIKGRRPRIVAPKIILSNNIPIPVIKQAQPVQVT